MKINEILEILLFRKFNFLVVCSEDIYYLFLSQVRISMSLWLQEMSDLSFNIIEVEFDFFKYWEENLLHL